jgi:uncharacterized repeat protein (TIGR02059 family)
MKKLLILVFIAISITLSGNTYYVSPSGSDSNPGSINAPFFTLNKAWTVVFAGDVIYLRGGTYQYVSRQSLTGKSGTAANPIKIFAYPGEIPILTKSSSYTTPSWPNGLVYLVGNYTYWKGIEIANYTQATPDIWHGFVLVDGSNNKFEQINSHNNGHGMLIFGNSNNNLVLNCDFHNNYDPLTSGDPYGNADGLEIANITTGNTNTVKGCRCWSNSDDGIDLWQNEGNVIIDSCWTGINGFREDDITTGGDGNGIKCGKTVTDYGNTVLRTITHCISFKNRGKGFDQNGALCGIALYNNTSYLNLLQGYYLYLPAKVHMLKNDIDYQSSSSSISAGSILSNNTFTYLSNNPAYPVSVADFMSVDWTEIKMPRKSDGSLPDINFLHLATGSSLIDKGVDVGLPYSGTAPDLGAFEKQTGTSVTIPVYTSSAVENATPSSLEMTYNTSLANIVPVVSSFSVSVNSVTRSVNTVLVSGTKVILTLASALVYGDVVTVAYTKPATNPLQTTSGGVAASISAQTVNNKVNSGQLVLTIEGTTVTNTLDTWLGVNIARSLPTTFTYRNNSITTTSNNGYMLQAGDEITNSLNNNLDGAVITGNKFIWNGTNGNNGVHGLFTGYNKNVVIKYNYLDRTPSGIQRKGWGMINTSGGIAYNILKDPILTGVVIKGMQGVKVLNNTFYSTQIMYTGPGVGTWRGLVEIYANDDAVPNSPPSSGTKIFNNIFYTKHQIYNIHIYASGDLTDFESDYNVFYCEDGTPIFNYLGTLKTFAQWQALGYDKHSVVVNPNFTNFTDFVPRVRLDYGIDLGTTWQAGLSVDAVWGTTDPKTTNQNGAWQVGARVYGPTGTITVPGYTSSAVQDATPALLEMTYDQTLANIIPATSAFSVHVNSITRSINSVAISGIKVSLTLASAIVYGDVVTVAYTKPSSNPLQTSLGGQAISISAQTVNNNVNPVNSVTPVYLNSAIEDSTPALLEMTYSLDLANTVPPATAFTVKTNGANRKVTSVAISGKKVKLSLESAAVFGDNVTVSYTKPASNGIKASVGEAESISSQPVINNILKITNSGPGSTEAGKITIYPNPAHDFFNILFGEPTLVRQIIKIIDLSGKIVFKDFIDQGITNIRIPISLRTGIYIVSLESGKLILFTQKLILNQ